MLWVTGLIGTKADGSIDSSGEEQIRRSFENCAKVLESAGSSWDEVVELTTYTVDLRALSDAMLAIAADYLSAPYPAWTAVGVAELFSSKAAFELSCVAVVASGLDTPVDYSPH